MAIAKVQGAYRAQYGGTPVTASFVSNPTAGNLMVALGRSNSGGRYAVLGAHLGMGRNRIDAAASGAKGLEVRLQFRMP